MYGSSQSPQPRITGGGVNIAARAYRWVCAHTLHFLAIVLVVILLLDVWGHWKYASQFCETPSRLVRLMERDSSLKFYQKLRSLHYVVPLGLGMLAGMIALIRRGRP